MDQDGATDLQYDNAIQEPVLRAIPGGAELIAELGFVPWFHDDEIERLELVGSGNSRLVIKAMVYGSHVETRACRVAFSIAEIVELSLEHFHKQNALFALRLRPAPIHSGPIYGADPAADDIEMVLEAAAGMAGLIRCRGVSITFHALPPRKASLHGSDWT